MTAIISIALAVFATLVLVACRPVAAQSPSCPCLQTATWPILGTDGSSTCNQVLVGGEVHCYANTYGLGSCARHDENREPYCDGSSPAAYCAEPWCFVDPVTCRGSTKRFAESSTLIDGASKAYYSYDTCGGDASKWDDLVVNSLLNGKTLKAAVAIPYYYPDHYIEDEAGEPIKSAASYAPADLPAGAKVKGLWIDFYEKIAKEANFTLDWRPVSGGSKGAHSSSFTACAQDVADGIVDLCVGDYWTTEERLSMTTFTTGTLTDSFSVLSRKQLVDPETISHKLAMAGSPFSIELWMTCLAVCVATGIFYNVLRVGYKEYLPAISRSQMSLPQKSMAWIKGSAAYTFGAFLEFTSQDVQAGYDMRGNPVPNRAYELNLVKMAWSLFCMFVLLFYSASLTARLVQDNRVKTGITTLDECQQVKCKVCVPGVMMPTMKRLYKDRILYHASTSSTNVFRDLEKGECDLGLMIDRRFNTMWSSGEYTLDAACGFKIGEAVMPIGCSQPVRQEYASAISYWAKKIADKDYFLGSLIEDTYMPSPPCPVAEVVDLGSYSLGVDEFFAPLMIYVILVFFALMSRVLFTARKHKMSFKKMSFSLRRRKSSEKPSTSIEAPPGPKSPEDELPPVPERARA